jgi:hypothetical protein
MNGLKNIHGYRAALNLSYGDNSSGSCDPEDDVETGAILVMFAWEPKGTIKWILISIA